MEQHWHPTPTGPSSPSIENEDGSHYHVLFATPVHGEDKTVQTHPSGFKHYHLTSYGPTATEEPT
jgi:hypothetical protein